MKHFFVIVSLIILIFQSIQCKERIEWINPIYNFGLIHEDEGIKEGEFKLVNLGKSSLLIQRIKTTCGCTTVEFPKDFINEGDTATITIQYNPVRRPGKINKELKVYFDKTDSVYTLKFIGSVLGSDHTLETQYPYREGNLRFERLNLKTDTLTKGMKRHLFLEMYNQGLDTISPVLAPDIETVQCHYNPSISIVQGKIPPGESSTLMIEIDSSKISGYGKKNFTPFVKWGHNNQDSIGINVSTVILPKPVKQSNESLGQIKITKDIIEVNKLTKDEEIVFEIENVGDGPLKLYGILPEQEDVIEAIFPEEIGKGEKGELKILVKYYNIPEGVFRINFDIISNDSYFPLSSCRVVGIK